MNRFGSILLTKVIYIVWITLGITFQTSLHAQFQAIGNANSTGGNCYELTGAFNTQFGAIWSDDLINLNESFEAQFQLYLGNNNGGADGIVFVFQPVSNSVGSLGGGLGYEGIVPSVGVEFDTWQNGNYNDIPNDHVALMKHGLLDHTQALTPPTPMPNIEDGLWHDVRITWDADINKLKVYWECSPIISYEGDIVTNIFSGNPMVFWGFTSATGSANNLHQVCIDYISFLDKLPDREICEDQATLIGGTANPDFTYLWSPAATLNNPNIANPLASPDVDTDYILQITDACGFNFFDTVNVVVKPRPEISIWEDEITACEGTSITLDATTENAEEYDWNPGTGSNATLEVSNTGFYSVEVTVDGCSETDGVFVEFFPFPFVELGDDITVCETETVLLDATSNNVTYQWQNGETTATLEATAQGTFTVTITSNDSGCSAIEEIGVSFLSLPSFDLGEPQSLCEGESVFLDAATSNSTYQWQDGSDTPILEVNATGIYTVTVTNSETNCSATDSISITVNPLPQFDLGEAQTLCEGESTLLDATTEGGTYQWQNGETTSTLSVTNTGVYAVTISLETGCSNVDMVNVNVNPLPEPDLGEDQTLCEGETTILIAPNADSYEWQNGLSLPIFEVSESGVYTVTVTIEGCKGTDEVSVVVNPLPSFNLEPVPPLCEGETYTIAAPNAENYTWQDGSTDPTLEVATSGIYTVTITQNDCSASDEVSITVNPLPTFDLGEAQTLCEGESITLSAPVSDSYLWQDGSLNPTLEVSEAGTYAVTISENNCTSSNQIDISFDELPDVELGEAITLCEGQSITLDATPSNVEGVDFIWSDGTSNPSIEVTLAGTYAVTVSNGNCVSSDEVVVDFNANPSIDLGVDETLCEGETLVLDATVEGATYQWQDSSNASTFEVTQAGIYSVTVNLNGCILEGSIEIDYNPLPTIDLGEDQTICENETILLDATIPNATYEWQDGSTNPTFEVSGNGTYSVEITVDGCTATDAVGVAQITLPPIDLGEDISVCEGEAVEIGLEGIFTTDIIFGWQDGTGGQYYEVTESGIYTITASINQCMTTDEINVSFNEIPTINLGEDQSICEGESVIFDATHSDANAIYHWSNAAATPMIEVSASGIYTVTVSVNNCSTTDEVELVVNELPVIELGEPLSFCEGESFVLDATAANLANATYEWQDGSNAPTLEALVSGIYVVTVTSNDCAMTDEVELTFNESPQVELGNDVTLCSGESLQLDATVADNSAIYEWESGADTPSIEVTEPGTYAVTVTVNNCSTSDVINVDFDELGLIDLGPDMTLCEGETLVLDATTDGGTYEWQDNSNSPTFEVIEAGIYAVTINVGACILQGSIEVDYNPVPSVDLGENQTICEGDVVTFDATTPNATYEWQNGSTDPTFEADQTGVYFVEIEVDGCTATDFVQVERIELPAIDLGEDREECEGQLLALSISGEFPTAVFEWQDGTIGQDYLVTESGAYAVSVTIEGCSTSEELNVLFHELPSLTLEDVTLCEGGTSVLTPFAEDAGTAVYEWSNGLVDSNIEVSESGVYAVTVTDNGCSSVAVANVVFDEAPIIDLGQDTTLCAGQSLVLQAPAADSYLWQDGSVGASLEVVESGVYSVEAIAGTCQLSGEIRVDFANVPTVELGEDLVLCEGQERVLEPQVTDAATFLWQDGSTEPTYSILEAGEYVLEVRGTLEDCSATDVIRVDFEVCEEPVEETFSIVVPNAFTPNEDGVNDEFKVSATDEPDDFYFAVFNRWGEKVFETKDVDASWDGVYQNEIQPVGVYVFYTEAFKMVNGELERFWKQGNVTLLR